MHKYHCLNPIAAVGLDLFSDDYQKVEDLKDAEAVLVRSAAMHDLELPEGLAAVARAGAGVNNIPLDKCAEKGIVVFNTPGANANGVKELVFAGMLYASRDIVGGIDWCLANQNDENIAKTAEKQKKNFAGTEISGKKLGVIGLGAIGVLVANAATHMGMEVYGYDPYISVSAAWSLSRSVKHISNVEDIYRGDGGRTGSGQDQKICLRFPEHHDSRRKGLHRDTTSGCIHGRVRGQLCAHGSARDPRLP